MTHTGRRTRPDAAPGGPWPRPGSSHAGPDGTRQGVTCITRWGPGWGEGVGTSEPQWVGQLVPDNWFCTNQLWCCVGWSVTEGPALRNSPAYTQEKRVPTRWSTPGGATEQIRLVPRKGAPVPSALVKAEGKDV